MGMVLQHLLITSQSKKIDFISTIKFDKIKYCQSTNFIMESPNNFTEKYNLLMLGSFSQLIILS